jgi:hypothetical protein
VFENRVPTRIFGPKSDEMTGGWRKLHNEELRDLYWSSSILRMMKKRKMGCKPKCFTSVLIGIGTLLMFTWGQRALLVVNVI